MLHVQTRFVPTGLPVEAELRGITITGGRAEGGGISVGGGIWNEGTLMLTDCTVSRNRANLGTEPVETVGGGGIFGGPLTLVRSTVSENRTTGLGDADDEGGGGIYGSATLIDSTVSGNTTRGNGGGIFSHGTVVLINSTVSANEAGGMGGGIEVRAELIMTNSTVSGNTASESAGGVFADFGTLTVINSTIAGNSSVDASIRGGEWTVTGTLIEGVCSFVVMSSGAHNIESPNDTCGFDQATDQVEVTAEQLALGPLQDNGGPTETHALGEGSVAIDVIPLEDCVDADGAPLATDQRGEPRPETGGTLCDVGALEVQFIATCFQDDECGPLICCHLGSPFEPGTCETQAVCDELQGGG